MILRTAAARRVVELDTLVTNPTMRRLLLIPEGRKPLKSGSYVTVQEVNRSTHASFRELVDGLFNSNEELARLFDRWFHRGQYDFTIDETLRFLSLDQHYSHTNRLALVLSGGGVKSLYQATLLDHLYGKRLIANGVQPTEDEDALDVRTVVGTSGGAMVGLFASLLSRDRPEPITPALRETSRRMIFPPLDVPRVLSVLGVLFVFFGFLAATKTIMRKKGMTTTSPTQKTAPKWVTAMMLSLLVLGSLCIVVGRVADPEAVSGMEGFSYVLTAIAVHFGLTCIERRTSTAPLTPSAQARVSQSEMLMVLGVIFVFAAVALRIMWYAEPAPYIKAVAPWYSLAASVGVLIVALGILHAAAAEGWGLTLHEAPKYISSLVVASAIVLAAHVPLLIAWLIDGPSALLELTPLFWIILGIGTVAAVAVALYAGRHPTSFTGGALRFLAHDRQGAITTTPALTMVGVFGLGLACWAAVVAPAIYGNVLARTVFADALRVFAPAPRFNTSLIVTGALLSSTRCSSDQGLVREGDIYFCFPGPNGECGEVTDPDWHVHAGDSPSDAIDEVFASGSAFPVFPAKAVNLPNGCEVRLVDGGYAHNVPLEAAFRTQARQVLIINASPVDDELSLTPRTGLGSPERLGVQFSQLVRNIDRLFGFMFSRAQEVDRTIGANLLVASLGPRLGQGEPSWPFLMDFRSKVRDRMIEVATADIELQRRIGSVQSWGRPPAGLRITATSSATTGVTLQPDYGAR